MQIRPKATPWDTDGEGGQQLVCLCSYMFSAFFNAVIGHEGSAERP